MIIVGLYGGLGNQMFQYALGRYLSYKLNTELKLDISNNLNRQSFSSEDILFINNIFNLNCQIATKKEIKAYKLDIHNEYLMQVYFQIKDIITNFFPNKKYKFIRESYSGFDDKILKLSGNCYLFGYWPSEKYFKGIEEIIREDFEIKKPIEINNQFFIERINDSESVSIHLRGRDYINNEKTREFHFTCNEEYYNRCLKYISEKIKNPNFFVFSDDPEWAKVLKTDYNLTFIEGNIWNKTGYEDMRLMSLCKHNIIANSSFSWWGAWLNNNPNKIVIAPKKWFNNPDINTEDLIPEKWVRL